MSVYFATCREANAVKIGHSLEPYSRMADLQVGCPLPMKLEAILPGGLEEERIYHARFSEHRIHGEWFHITDIIELMIEQNPAPPPPEKRDAKEARRDRARQRREERERQRERQLRQIGGSAWLDAGGLGRAQRRNYEAAMAEMRTAQGIAR